MALRVWLPLNGNLENKGLSGPSNGEGTLTYGDGKIGKALYMETASTANGIYVPKQERQVYTVALWFKAPGYTGTRRDLCNEGRDYNTYGWRAGLEANSNTLTIVAASSGGTYTQSFIPDTWYHVAFSRDKSKNVYIYINGVLVSTRTGTGDLNYSESNGYINIGRFCHGSSNSKLYPYQGYLNDFRYYDECLSPKQVKEISKGLIAHYKLSGPEVNENILKNTRTLGSPAGSAGTIINNAFQGFNAYYLKYEGTSYKDAYSITSVVSPTAGEKYTLTFYAKGNCNIVCFFYPNTCSYGISSQGRTTTAADGAIAFNLSESWTKYWVTWTVSSSLVEGNKNIVVGRIQNQGEGAECYISKLKFEKGDVPTEWIPNTTDKEYTALGYNNILTTDVSGNGYNLTSVGTFSFSGDSPRYGGTGVFTSNSTYLKLPILDTSGFANSFTIIYWAKIADISGKMAWGFQNGNRLNIYPTGSKICCNTGDSANNPYQNDSGTDIGFSQWNDGNWHQYAMVGDGTTNKLYVDGEYQGKAKTYKGISGTQIYISGWDTGTNYKWTNGSISDFRMYATALSADDIKQLYQTSALVDKGQSFYTYEFKEV